MAKCKGIIGFVKNEEIFSGSGTYQEVATEHPYYFDTVRDYPKWDDKGEINESINLNNKFSFIADSFAKENLGYMRYMIYKGFRWEIKSFEILFPRINIYVGGEYHGETKD